MASDLLSSFISQSALTIKEVNPGQLPVIRAQTLQIKQASIKFSSRVMRHMLEDGSSVVDCRVIMPTTLSLDVFCPTVSDLSQVTTIMGDRAATYDIKTRGIQLTSMMLDTENISQVPEVLSATPVKLTFKELLIQGSQQPIRAESGDSSVIDRGMSALNEVADSAKASFNSAVDKARSAVDQVGGLFG